MRYTIVSINDRCLDNKRRTERIMGGPPVPMKFFDASVEDPVSFLEAHDIKQTDWKPELGEVGAYISHYLTWWEALKGDLIVFEDDAVVAEDFWEQFNVLEDNLPEYWEFLSLWVPENQENHYMETISAHPKGLAPPVLLGQREASMFYENDVIAKSYQGYGQVATLYSPDGASCLIGLAKQYGLYATVDCFMHFQSLAGNLEGFAPVPEKNTIVSHDWDAKTTVHGTGY